MQARAIAVLICALCCAHALADPAPRWKLRSKHFLYGMPVATDDRYNFTPGGYTEDQPGISVLIREGFAIGHADRFKVPLWVSMRWTKDDYQCSVCEPSYSRPFKEDYELPAHARGGTSYNFSLTQMQRGHMARHKDNATWGKDNSDAGCFMSNIVPQHVDLNGGDWGDLEDAHRNIVSGDSPTIKKLWVISGPVFDAMQPQGTVSNGVGVPQATYKVIGWFGQDGNLRARGYILKQDDKDKPLESYLKPIDDIEQRTGLDFFPELNLETQNQIETAEYATLWQD